MRPPTDSLHQGPSSFRDPGVDFTAGAPTPREERSQLEPALELRHVPVVDPSDRAPGSKARFAAGDAKIDEATAAIARLLRS